MSTLLLLKFFHLLGFVYWLGGDLGTYYASRVVTRADLDAGARATAFNIMMGCDQAPRLCMPLIFALGFHLAVRMGFIDGSAGLIALNWVVCLGWVGMVLAIHFGHGKSWLPGLQAFDIWFRYAMILIIGGTAIYALLTGTLYNANWVAVKSLVFALLMVCGMMIRRCITEFVPAWIELQSKGPSDQVNAVIAKSINGCKPYVHAIWIGLLFNAAIGIHLINF